MTMAERKRFLLRISPELFEELNRWAAQEFRSINSQIEYLLEQAVQERRRSAPRAAETHDLQDPATPDGVPSPKTSRRGGPGRA
jgi:hypothetical protein